MRPDAVVVETPALDDGASLGDVGDVDHLNPMISGPNFTVRDDRYRLISYRNGDREVYDHVTDPYEWHNMIFRRENKRAENIARKLGALVPSQATWKPRQGWRP